MEVFSHYELVIVGAGAAGMAAAVSAGKKGIKKILIVDRNEHSGGILRQCIHDGFGLHLLQVSMTGPEYAEYWQAKMGGCGAEISLSTTILDIDYEKKPYRLTFLNEEYGYGVCEADAIILACGCRERTLGQMRIPGSRPAGVYTAGTAQYMMNVRNLLPGRTAVILGSGDIGLIMARRFTLEGIKVRLILGEAASGLARNHIQCVKDFGIPIRFGYTVLSIHGYRRLKGVTIAPLDAGGMPRIEEKEYIQCDTLLVAAGLIPETELWSLPDNPLSEVGGILTDAEGRTSQPGVFACGNVTKIFDLVDKVSLAGEKAGIAAYDYLYARNKNPAPNHKNDAFFERREPTYEALAALGENEMICTRCPRGCILHIAKHTGNGRGYDVSGEGCKKGMEAALEELTMPKRILTTTVKVEEGRSILIPVRSENPVPKGLLRAAVKECNRCILKAPVSRGQVVLGNVAGSGVDMIASGTVEKI
ncbi:FAD-dependent oxidoreductase [Parasporobacterium paucivorans]|uniref:CxxC motif-containing protein n=1 Tax=Parasporobacterium paucivorans DSM 15970 TaxID=1122934 RepID=A0A1M6K6Y4_9FIRM|nr:FAD-dependent oxidoreductase [Parasporobacterium paucivorans]SHJ54613.1 CxxC motif-containing protein [Parasporobacterium paucivorans DSM 15970]